MTGVQTCALPILDMTGEVAEEVKTKVEEVAETVETTAEEVVEKVKE